jgi:lipoprotein-releasing system ATP-binding protein
MTEASNELVLADVTKTYAGGHAVLQGASLSAEPGETVSVVGPSGCGKSTLLNIVGSLDRPTSGTVRLGEIDVGGLRGDALAAFRARMVGFIFQDHHLLPQLTALENTLLPSLAGGREGAESRGRELLDRVGVSGRAEAFPAQLSGGERQRVAVARAMLNQPRLLLCDEPTGNLDMETGDQVVSMFLELAAERGVTVLMVTHNLAFATRFARCYELRQGRLVEADY